MRVSKIKAYDLKRRRRLVATSTCVLHSLMHEEKCAQCSLCCAFEARSLASASCGNFQNRNGENADLPVFRVLPEKLKNI